MMLFRFMACLAAGMFGVSLVLKTLLDHVFLDWDIVAEIKNYLSKLARPNLFPAHAYEYEEELPSEILPISVRTSAVEPEAEGTNDLSLI